MNKPFIDEAIARGDTIIFDKNPWQAGVASTYFKEAQYVLNSGYTNVIKNF